MECFLLDIIKSSVAMNLVTWLWFNVLVYRQELDWGNLMYDNDLRDKRIVDARYDGSIHLNLADGNRIALEPYGDCCANCYVQHVDGADALMDATIKNIQDLDIPVPSDEEDEYSTVEAWGHRIITDKGVCTIEMRVVHNGYYGGSLNDRLIKDCHSQAKLLEDF
jgi:hypothetical protein